MAVLHALSAYGALSKDGGDGREVRRARLFRSTQAGFIAQNSCDGRKLSVTPGALLSSISVLSLDGKRRDELAGGEGRVNPVEIQ
jgi:hypothetical protein